MLTQGTVVSFKLKNDEQISCLVQLGQKKGLLSAINGASIPSESQTEQYISFSNVQVQSLQIVVGEDIQKPMADDPSKKKPTRYV